MDDKPRTLTEILQKQRTGIQSNLQVENKNTDTLADDLDEKKFRCSICKDTGFVVLDVPPAHPSFGRAVICQCREKYLEKERYRTMVNSSELGELRDKTFGNFMFDPKGSSHTDQLSLRMALELAIEFATNPNGWLLISGKYGRGKTHLAAAIANYCIETNFSVVFVNAPDLLDYLRSAFDPNSQSSYEERFEKIKNSPLLILDDFGTQNNTPWAQEKLYQIFNHRYNARLPTVITTNESLKSVEQRIRSRISDWELVKNIDISAPDYRRQEEKEDTSGLSILHLYEDATFETFNINIAQSKADRDNLRMVLEASKAYANEPQGWFVLYSNNRSSNGDGGRGNGKTHLAASIANHIRQHLNWPISFIFAPDLLDHLRATYHPTSVVTYDKLFDEIKNVHVLVLDDLGTESPTAWAREKMYQLLKYRSVSRLPTIVTTSAHFELDMEPRLRVLLQNYTLSHCVEIKAGPANLR